MTFHLQREPIIFSNKEDPHIPKEIAEELSLRDNVVEVAFSPGGLRKSQYRVTLKHSDDFYACILYIQSVWLFLYVQLSFFYFHLFYQMDKWTADFDALTI